MAFQSDDDMESVLLAMGEGSIEAFDRFYSRYAPFVFHIAKRLLGDVMEAEDLCHDVFLEALRRSRSYDPARGSVESWLAIMTRSRGLDKLRKSKRLDVSETAGEEKLASPADHIEQLVVRRIQKEALQEAVQTLPSRQKEAVAYSFYGSRTHKELSEAWNVPLGTVKSWVRYGVNNIRKQMEKQGWGKDDRQSEKGDFR